MDKYINLFTDFGFKKILEEEVHNNQDSLKYYRDLKNVIDTAVEEAIEQKVIEIVKELSKDKVAIGKIAAYTGLSVEKIT